jgi:iron(III) transport system ATP-binding protein
MKLGVAQQIATPLEVYNNPANKFVFSFIGLSNFLEAVWAENGPVLCGSGVVLPPELVPGGNVRGVKGTFSLASRPSEIDFVGEGENGLGSGLRGVVTRRAFLGEIVDYRVKIGDQEMRVQKGRRAPGPEVGETCALRLNRPFWFAGE